MINNVLVEPIFALLKSSPKIFKKMAQHLRNGSSLMGTSIGRYGSSRSKCFKPMTKCTTGSR